LTVCPSDLLIHGFTFRLPETLVEAALQAEFSHTLVSLDHSGDFEKTVGGTDFTDTWGITAADNNTVFSLLDDFEVIGNDGSDFVLVFKQVLAVPKLVGGFGATVLSVKVGSLGNVSCRPIVN
jgi:hypothetical protein